MLNFRPAQSSVATVSNSPELQRFSTLVAQTESGGPEKKGTFSSDILNAPSRFLRIFIVKIFILSRLAHVLCSNLRMYKLSSLKILSSLGFMKPSNISKYLIFNFVLLIMS